MHVLLCLPPGDQSSIDEGREGTEVNGIQEQMQEKLLGHKEKWLCELFGEEINNMLDQCAAGT